MEVLYSLGTVVKIKDDSSEYTIIGYCPLDKNNKMYTYVGINAALGISVRPDARCFDNEAIKEVVFLGYSDEQSENFRIRLGYRLAKGSEE